MTSRQYITSEHFFPKGRLKLAIMFCLLLKHEEGVAMNRLLLLALVSFVLAVDLALPYSDYEEPSNDEMEEVSNDFKAREAETLSWDEN